jgi:sn-glycerol 3-phosphate transport system substrate-binding protein
MGSRRVALAAVLVLAAGLTACGDKGSNGSSSSSGSTDSAGEAKKNCPYDALSSVTTPVELNVWFAFQGLPAKAIEQLATDYNASQKRVHVTVANQGSYEEQLAKYKTGLGKPESLPGVITAEDTNTRFIVDSNSVVAAADCIAADPKGGAVFDDLVPAIAKSYTYKGKLLPGGFAISNPALYFNEGHFAAAGLDINKPPATLAELRTAAEKLKAAAIPGLSEPLVLRMEPWFIEHWLTGQMQPVVNEENGHSAPPTKSLLNDPKALELFTWLKGMVNDGLLKAVKSTDELSEYLAVATGAGSMLIQTSAAITTIDAAIAGTLNEEILPQIKSLPIDAAGLKFDSLKIGVAPVPGVSAAGKGQIGGNAWYIVRKTDAEVAAAWDFLKFANSTEQQVKWTLAGGYLPSHTSVASSPELLADWNSTRKGGWQKIAYSGVTSLDPTFTGPWMGAYSTFRSEAATAMDKIALSGEDPTAAITAANDRISAAFAEYNKNPGQG